MSWGSRIPSSLYFKKKTGLYEAGRGFGAWFDPKKLIARSGTWSDSFTFLKKINGRLLITHCPGTHYKRQGEFFFVPVSAAEAKRLDKLAAQPKAKKRITLQAGANRPNEASGMEIVKGKPVPSDLGWQAERALPKEREYFVTGKVSHTGREHADLILRGWFKAYANTATESFTITGDID